MTVIVVGDELKARFLAAGNGVHEFRDESGEFIGRYKVELAAPVSSGDTPHVIEQPPE